MFVSGEQHFSSAKSAIRFARNLGETSSNESAIGALVDFAKSEPVDVGILGLLGDYQFEVRDFKAALATYTKVLGQDETVPVSARIGYAATCARLGKTSDAIDQCETILSTAPATETAVQLAKLFLDLDTVDEQWPNLQRYLLNLDKKKQIVDACIEISKEALRRNNLVFAMSVFDFAIEHRGRADQRPMRLKVDRLLERHKFAHARATIEKWKSLQPESDQLALREPKVARPISEDVKVVALYLPQFHPIPENDEWWGKGFTEWRNVTRSKPMWHGHTQPRTPTDLGFYDLRVPETFNEQANLARRYGIDAFCYYYYWFNGRKLLDRPLSNVIDGKTDAFPVSICWVNEDWTRSWDGFSGEVMVENSHSPEMNMRFIEDVYPILSSPNYLRVDGRPFLAVYRAQHLDGSRTTTDKWRQYCKDRGLGDLYLCAVQSFGFGDPSELGFDAAMEFPPHRIGDPEDGKESHVEIADLPGLDPTFQGKVYSYPHLAETAMARDRQPYTLHRTSMLAWDNSARRGKFAHAYGHFSVDTYKQWTASNLRKAAIEQSDPLVFVNAWNEWAEGSVLEPDADYGHEMLEATRAAKELAKWPAASTYWSPSAFDSLIAPETEFEQILCLGHDAHRNGAQINLLRMIQELVRGKNRRVTLILREGGELVAEYEQFATVFVAEAGMEYLDVVRSVGGDLKSKGTRKAITNTCLTGDAVPELKKLGYRVLSLVHELPGLIDEYGLESQCEKIAEHTDHLVFAANYVADGFATVAEIDSDKIEIEPQGIRRINNYGEKSDIRVAVRRELGVAKDAKVVVGCGFGDLRKGIDLFVQLARNTTKQHPDYCFVWIGEVEAQLKQSLAKDIEEIGHGKFFETGFTSRTAEYMLAADAFALTSREDPFPSVVMEAMDAGLPVFGFEDSGGFAELVGDESGGLVPYLSLDEFQTQVTQLLSSDNDTAMVAERNRAYSVENFGYPEYMQKLLNFLTGDGRQAGAESVRGLTTSVIVPNYNYAEYLDLRLASIFNQTKRPDQVIILDDASTDGSWDVIEAYRHHADIEVILLQNERNSGSVFLQWQKGLELATKDLVWIAEADDYCDPGFLAEVTSHFHDPDVALCFSNSTMVDAYGDSYGEDYSSYYELHFGEKFNRSFQEPGEMFASSGLLPRNSVVNASAAVFRNTAAQGSIEEAAAFRASGDWMFWLNVCRKGDVKYLAKPLNYHRRHSKSVVGQALEQRDTVILEMCEIVERAANLGPVAENPEAIAAAINGIEATYEDLYSVDGRDIPDIRNHPTLSLGFNRLVENAVPLGYMQVASNVHDDAPSPHGIKGRTGLLFAGSFDHSPNIGGIKWFCEEVLPLVWQEEDSIHLHIVGSNPPAEVLALESDSVWVHDFVPDVSPFYDTTRLLVAPLRDGEADIGAISQALARGLPVVGTPMATEGMSGTPGQDFLAASTPEEFAEEILDAYFDGTLLKELADNGRELYERSFLRDSPADLFEEF